MKWRRPEPSRPYLQSACGKYRIARYETADGTVYALWRVNKRPALHYGDLQSCKERANEADSGNGI